MKTMMSSSVLLIGVHGLGVEIAKNLVLSGVKSLTLHDKSLTTIRDLSAQYYLREDDIGGVVDGATLERLADLNRNVQVSVFPKKEVEIDDLSAFNVWRYIHT